MSLVFGATERWASWIQRREGMPFSINPFLRSSTGAGSFGMVRDGWSVT